MCIRVRTRTYIPIVYVSYSNDDMSPKKMVQMKTSANLATRGFLFYMAYKMATHSNPDRLEDFLNYVGNTLNKEDGRRNESKTGSDFFREDNFSF